MIARLDEGVVILDLDGDGDEGSGWTLLYLHITRHDALAEGQPVEAGNILGYASCLGGYSTATHLHLPGYTTANGYQPTATAALRILLFHHLS